MYGRRLLAQARLPVAEVRMPEIAADASLCV